MLEYPGAAWPWNVGIGATPTLPTVGVPGTWESA